MKVFFIFLFCVFISFTSYSEASAKIKKVSARQELKAKKKALREARHEKISLEKAKRRKIRALYKKALSYYAKDEITRAEQTFKEILALDRKQKRARFYIDKKLPPRRGREVKKRAKEQKKAKKEAAKEQAKAEKEAVKRAKREKISSEKEKQQRIKDLYKKALSYYSKDEITRAEQTFKEILVLDPKQKKAKFYITKKLPPRQGREVMKRIKEKRILARRAKREAKKKVKTKVSMAPLSDSAKRILLDESIRDFISKKAKEKDFGLLREKRIRLKLNTSFVYDSNIYLTKESPKRDLIIHVSPSVRLEYATLNRSLSGFYNADAIMHSDYFDENRVNHNSGIKLDFFKQSPLKISLSDTAKHTTEPATSETTAFVRRFNNKLTGTIRYDMSPKTSIAFDYKQSLQHYLSSGYRAFSYLKQEFNPTLYWHFLPKTSLTAGYSLGLTDYYDDRDYTHQLHQFRGGIEGKLTQKSTIHLRSGLQYRYYNTSEIKNLYAFVLGGAYDYRLSPKTRLEFTASHNVNESTYEDVGYYRSLDMRLSCLHHLLNNVDVNLGGFYTRSPYPRETSVSIGEYKKRLDELYGGNIKIDWRFRDWLSVYTQYEFRYRDSTIRDFRYKDNRISGGFQASF